MKVEEAWRICGTRDTLMGTAEGFTENLSKDWYWSLNYWRDCLPQELQNSSWWPEVPEALVVASEVLDESM